MPTYRISFCMNSASARILARVVGAFAVISAVFFLISGEASLLPLARPLSHMPIAFQSWNPLLRPQAALEGGSARRPYIPTQPAVEGNSGPLAQVHPRLETPKYPA